MIIILIAACISLYIFLYDLEKDLKKANTEIEYLKNNVAAIADACLYRNK